MLKSVIIAQTTLSDFLSDSFSRHDVLSGCDIVHFDDGLTNALTNNKNLDKVISQLGQNESKARIKLSISLRRQPQDVAVYCRAVEDQRTNAGADKSANPTVSQLLGCIAQIIDRVDYIELDAQVDLIPPILELIPAHKRIITRRLDTSAISDKRKQQNLYLADSAHGAFLYRMICDDGLRALEFLHHIGHGDTTQISNVIAYARDEDNLYSRICAAYKGLGMPVIFTNLDKDSRVSLQWLQKNYNLRTLPATISKLYGIIGTSISHSFSPLVHNKGLQALQLPAVYLPFKIDSLAALDDHMTRLEAIDLPVCGLTITAPLKASINTAYPANRAIIDSVQSANVLMRNKTSMVTETTDDFGLTRVIKQQNIAIKGKQVAVIGCGCSGRVSAYTLAALGAEVTLYNRNPRHGALAEQLLNLPCKPLESLDLSRFDLLVNTVPFATDNDITFAVNNFNPDSVYIDFVYNPYPNALLAQANLSGLSVIDGLTMLNSQLHGQFGCLTGQPLPPPAEQALDEILTGKRNKPAYINQHCLQKVS